MISLIGTTHTTIGFGLCGIKDLHEVSIDIDKQDLAEILKKTKHDIVMVDEVLVPRLPTTQKTIIIIPYRNGQADTAFIDDLFKNTIGVVKVWEK